MTHIERPASHSIPHVRAALVDDVNDEDFVALNALWDGIADGLSAHSDPESLFRDTPGCGRYWLMLYRQAVRRIA